MIIGSETLNVYHYKLQYIITSIFDLKLISVLIVLCIEVFMMFFCSSYYLLINERIITGIYLCFVDTAWVESEREMVKAKRKKEINKSMIMF